MKYVQPYGVSDANASYINGNPALGIEGSAVPAGAIEYSQREIVNAIHAAGLTPSNDDLSQLSKAIQVMIAGTPQSYILPPATNKILGGVIVDKGGLLISSTGVLSLALQVGAGLVMTANGELSIDFSQMPTAKFEALLQSLKVPVWLTKNTVWYVDGTDGSDETEGISEKGQKPATAFKTINAAAQFVCSNYNFANYLASIRVTSGTYIEGITLPYYNATTGYLVIYGSEAWDTGKTTIQMTAGAGFNVSAQTGGGRTNINGIHFMRELDSAGTATNGKGCVEVNPGASIYMYGGSMTVIENGNSVGSPQLVRARGGAFNIQEAMTFTAFSAKAASGIYGLYIDGGSGVVNHSADVTVSGAFNTFCRADNGRYQRSTTNPVFITSGAVTGQRYAISSFGVMSTRGGGENFFPGSAAGSISANNQYT